MSTITPLLTTQEIRTKSQEVCDAFHDIGLMAVVPARPPLGPQVFSMGLDKSSEVFRFWVGVAKVDVIDVMEEPKRQAVVRVVENAHKVTMLKKIWTNGSNNPEDYVTTEFPSGTTFKFGDTGNTKQDPWGRYYNRTPVIANVPKFDNTFLMGYDEVKCFISQLPTQVKKVSAAHKILRPPALAKTALRQGEWFFVPATQEEILDINNFKERNNVRVRGQAQRARQIEIKNQAENIYRHNSIPLVASSSHRALQRIVVGDTTFARGYVFDGRYGRHARLPLEGWHRVIRNMEVTVKERSVRRTNWD